MSIQVLVTGYGGFLGQAVCRELLANGYRVRGLARNPYPELAQLGVECIQGSAADLSACERACMGVQAIVHTAAMAGVWGPKAEYERNNILATQNLLQLASRHAMGAFVFTSSPSVTFDGTPQSNVDESAPYPTHWLCDYPRTKAIAEREVLDSNGSHLATCALRPHLIWGEGDPHLIPRVLQRCRQRRLVRVGAGTNLIDTVHVDAAATAHRLALERMMDRDQQASGQAYFITDGEPVECWKWISTILALGNLEPPQRAISLETAYRLGWYMEWFYKFFGKAGEPPMTRFVAKQLGVDHYFQIGKAKKLLGYQPIENRVEILSSLVGKF